MTELDLSTRSTEFSSHNAPLLSGKTLANVPSSLPSLRFVLTLLRLSEHDPDVFYKFRQTLIEKCPYAPRRTQRDILIDAKRISENYYPLITKTQDVMFELGRVMMGIREVSTAP